MIGYVGRVRLFQPKHGGYVIRRAFPVVYIAFFVDDGIVEADWKGVRVAAKAAMNKCPQFGSCFNGAAQRISVDVDRRKVNLTVLI